MSQIGGLQCSDDLNKFHDRYWIHEVHSYDLRGSFGSVGKLRDGNGRSVARDDGLWLQNFIQS